MYRIKILSLLFLTFLLVVLSIYQIILPDRGDKYFYDAPGYNGELMKWAAPFSSGHPGIFEGSSEKVKLYLTSRIPMGKLGTGEDVSNSVVFLSSDQASYITGETMHVNGGMYMA